MSRRKRQVGFTLVELLVTIAIVAMLVALFLPAVQAAREAARVTQCKNNLKQLGLAALQHHDALTALPPARLMPRPGDTEVCGVGSPTWLVRILPYMEELTLYRNWDLSRPYAAHADSVRMTTVSSFFCPSRRDAGSSVLLDDVTRDFLVPVPRTAWGPTAWCPDCLPDIGPGPDPDPDDPDGPGDRDLESISVEYKRGGLSDYAANHGDPSPGFSGLASDFVFGGNGTGTMISSRPVCQFRTVVGWRDRIRAKDIVDGMSKTFLIGESHVRQDMLGVPPIDGPAYDGNHLPSSSRIAGSGFPLARSMHDEVPNYSFGSWHSGFCQFALCDGSVRAIDVETAPRVLGRWANRRDSL